MEKIVDYEGSNASDSDNGDEVETQNSVLSCQSSTIHPQQSLANSAEASTSGPSCMKLEANFVEMGFSKEMVAKAIKENGQGDADAVLATLLTYSALDESRPDCDSWSSESDGDILDDEFTDTDSCDLNEETMENLSDMEKNRLHLIDMGFPEDQISAAVDRCGPHALILELADSIYAAQASSAPSDGRLEKLPHQVSDQDEEPMDDLSEVEKQKLRLLEMGYMEDQITSAMNRCGPNSQDCELIDSIYAAETADMTLDGCSRELPHWRLEQDESGPSNLCCDPGRQRKKMKQVEEYNAADMARNKQHPSKKCKKYSQKNARSKQENILLEDDDERESFCIPSHNMVGFGIPNQPPVKIYRRIPEAVMGTPYFYYENVALAPKGVWETMSRFLYDIEPEFVDSKFFSATARKRGYIHNLPIQNRFQIQPIPPLTIQEALPCTKKWWPSWDPRTKFNCIQTCTASARLTERIRNALVSSSGPLSLKVQKYVLKECRKWNLVWVGTHKVAPLEPDEIESLLGFAKNHTRGGGISRTERFKALGNSFQVDTVGYHLSVLKNMFPQGITVLSLFTGIGGAEVALHHLGISLKNVVSVEVSEVNRNILRSWWDQTNQTGKLIEIGDVRLLTGDKLEQLIGTVGGFDLVIGGSPCNNLTGSNRVSRDGLEGKDSALFYDYFRILDQVRCIMGKNRW